MKKVIVLLLGILLFAISPIKAETLKTNVSKMWTVDIARQEAFKDAQQQFDLSSFEAIDPNLIGNKEAINKKKAIEGNRTVTAFSDGFYSIRIEDEYNFDKLFAYNTKGQLKEVYLDVYPSQLYESIKYYGATFDNISSLLVNSVAYPYKSYNYTYPEGVLTEISITVSPNNSYTFNPSGTLKSHWVNGTCYDVNGNIVMTRNVE